MKINVHHKIDMSKLIVKHQLEQYKIESSYIGYDKAIYLLYSKETINDDRIYRALVIKVKDEIVDESFMLGATNKKFNFFGNIGMNYFLVSPRAWRYVDGTNDLNATIVSKKGEIVRNICVGDGVMQVLTTKEEMIVVGYSDEGIYGTLGWIDPLGKHGVAAFNEYGRKIWENDAYKMSECYAINCDYKNEVWFYSDSRLVKTNFKNYTDYDIGVSGCRNFLILNDEKIIADGGMEEYNHFYLIDLVNMSKEEAYFLYEDEIINAKEYTFRDKQAVIFDDENNLYIVDVNPLEKF